MTRPCISSALDPIDAVQALNDANAAAPGMDERPDVPRAGNDEDRVAVGARIVRYLDAVAVQPGLKLLPERCHAANPFDRGQNAYARHAQSIS